MTSMPMPMVAGRPPTYALAPHALVAPAGSAGSTPSAKQQSRPQLKIITSQVDSAIWYPEEAIRFLIGIQGARINKVRDKVGCELSPVDVSIPGANRKHLNVNHRRIYIGELRSKYERPVKTSDKLFKSACTELEAVLNEYLNDSYGGAPKPAPWGARGAPAAQAGAQPQPVRPAAASAWGAATAPPQQPPPLAQGPPPYGALGAAQPPRGPSDAPPPPVDGWLGAYAAQSPPPGPPPRAPQPLASSAADPRGQSAWPALAPTEPPIDERTLGDAQLAAQIASAYEAEDQQLAYAAYGGQQQPPPPPPHELYAGGLVPAGYDAHAELGGPPPPPPDDEGHFGAEPPPPPPPPPPPEESGGSDLPGITEVGTLLNRAGTALACARRARVRTARAPPPRAAPRRQLTRPRRGCWLAAPSPARAARRREHVLRQRDHPDALGHRQLPRGLLRAPAAPRVLGRVGRLRLLRDGAGLRVAQRADAGAADEHGGPADGHLRPQLRVHLRREAGRQRGPRGHPRRCAQRRRAPRGACLGRSRAAVSSRPAARALALRPARLPVPAGVADSIPFRSRAWLFACPRTCCFRRVLALRSPLRAQASTARSRPRPAMAAPAPSSSPSSTSPSRSARPA
jgi:hypothetical protein